MSKINKLGKSTFVIAILSFILVAVLAFGGTYAYFSDTSNQVTTGDITLGTLILSSTELTNSADFVAEGGFAVPNQEVVDATVKASVDANIGYYVRAIVTVNWSLADGHTCVKAGDKKQVEGEDGEMTEVEVSREEVTCSADDIALTNPIVYTISHAKIAEGATAGAIMGSTGATTPNTEWFVVTDSTTNTTYLYLKARQEGALDLSLTINANVNSEVGDDESQHFMGAKFKITLQYQVCQADFVGEGNTNAGVDLTKDTVKTSAWANFTEYGLEDKAAVQG